MVRLGFAGEGYLLKAMARAYRQCLPGQSFTFFHPNAARCQDVAAELGMETTDFNLESFIDSVDAVIVGELPDQREATISRLIQAGKHVSLQKPFATTLEEVNAYQQAAKQSGAVVRVNEYARFHEPYLKLKQMLDRDEIGEVGSIRIQANLCGVGGWGPMVEYLQSDRMLFHPAFDKFALAIYLGGPIESVTSYLNSMEGGGQAVIGLKYAQLGCYGVIELTYAPETAIRTDGIPCQDNIEISGTDGIIWARHFHGKMTEEPWLEVRRGTKHYTFGIASGMKLEWGDCLQASAQHFLSTLHGKRKVKQTLNNATEALCHTLQVYSAE